MAKKCTYADSVTDNVRVEARDQESKIILAMEHYIGKINPMGDHVKIRLNKSKIKLENLKAMLADNKKKLQDTNITSKDKLDLKNRKKDLDKFIQVELRYQKYLKGQAKESKKHDKYKKKIFNLVLKRLSDLAVKHNMDINPEAYLMVLRHHMDQMGYRMSFLNPEIGKHTETPVANMNQMPTHQLVGMFNHLNKIFTAQESGNPLIAPKKKGIANKIKNIWPRIRSNYADSMQDPAIAMLLYDGSLKALDVVLKSQQVIDSAYHDEIKYTNKIKDLYSKLETFVDEQLHNNNEYFGVNEEDYATGRDGLIIPSEEEKKRQKSFENVVALLDEVMNGQVRRIAPSKFTYDANGSVQEKEDFKNYKNIINHIIKNKFWGNKLGRLTHKVQLGNQEVFYIMIPVGRLDYKAYLLPTEMQDNGYPMPLFPNNPKYLKFMAEHQDAFEKKMSSKWYRSDLWQQYKGRNKKTKKTVWENGWSDFVPYDVPNNIVGNPKNEHHATIRTLVGEFDSILEEVYNEVTMRTEKHNQSLTDSVNKITKGDHTKLGYFDKKGLTDMIQKSTEATGIYFNIYQDEDGNIFTENSLMGRIQENFFPRMYENHNYIAQLLHGADGIEQAMEMMQQEINSINIKLKDPDLTTSQMSVLINEKDIIKNELAKMPADRDMFVEKFDRALGRVPDNKIKPMSIDKKQRHGKARTRFMDPTQRRKDGMVMVNYIHDMYHTINFNELKGSLLESLPFLPKDVAEYVIDHVSAASGFTNSQAKFMGSDLNNKVWADRINKILRKRGIKEVTPDMMQNALKIYNTTISASVLRSTSSLSNNMQRSNYYIWERFDVVRKAVELAETDRGREIAENAGVLDLIQSLSDALLGGLSGDSRMTDGIAPLRDIALLRGNKDSFMHKSKWYDNFIKDHLVKIQERGGTEAELAEQVLLIKENLWETAHKLEAGRLKEDDLKRMYQLFAGKGLKMSWLRRFARWGLSWHFNPAKKLFTFTGVEEQMRKESAVIGAMLAVELGHVPKSWSDKNDIYMHPEAVRMARIVTYQHMFGMSTQFLPKMFRGTGKLVFQYKQYPYKQMINDYRIYKNVMASLDKDSTKMERFRELLSRPFRRGKDINDPDMNRAIKHLIWRGSMTISAISTFYIPIVYEMGKIGTALARRAGLMSANPMKRGLESPLFAIPLRAFKTLEYVEYFEFPLITGDLSL